MVRNKILYVVNVDWFFISHRLPLAIEALRRKFKVFLIAKDTGCFDELKDKGIECFNLNIERSGINPFKELIVINRLIKLYKEINPDLIHHITLKPSIYGTIASKKAKLDAKIINAITGLGYNFIGNRFFSINKKILISLINYAFKNKDINFIFQNPDDLFFYRKLKLVNNNFILIKGSGVDETIFKKKRKKENNILKIVLVARMLKDKGVIEFIEAANILKNKYQKQIKFILVGGIDHSNPAKISKEYLNNMCDNNYLVWLGFQKNIKMIYENADIVCLPSYREGLPKSIVEAMAMSCPIITTDVPGCRECVEDNSNGFLVPVRDSLILSKKIEKLILDKNLRIKMGNMSRTKMENEMSLKKVIEKTFKFYEK
jgi:glycosyltransferase involved in cell wall biosynthesis